LAASIVYGGGNLPFVDQKEEIEELKGRIKELAERVQALSSIVQRRVAQEVKDY
jgi:polyhydroxyalkanoate synthesis regulator phasin